MSKVKVIQSVSEWQGHLLSCRGELEFICHVLGWHDCGKCGDRGTGGSTGGQQVRGSRNVGFA